MPFASRRGFVRDARLILTLAMITVAASVTAQIKVTNSETTKLFRTDRRYRPDARSQERLQLHRRRAAEGGTGFQTAFGDLWFIGKFGKKQEIEVVFDLYFSSRNHPSTS